MKKNLFFAMLVISIQALSLNTTITFSGRGASTNISEVIVQNITQGTSVTVPAGNVLNLTDTPNAIEQLGVNDESIQIYPNTLNRKYTISFNVKNAGYAQLNAFSVDGKKVVGTNQNLQVGINSFQLGLPKGVFIIQVVGKGYAYTAKMISQSNTNSKAEITFVSTENSAVNKSQKSKSEVGITTMICRNNDWLLYKGVSGNYSSIQVASARLYFPTENRVFSFVDCQDASGNNYSTILVGNQIWMAENLKTSKYRNADNIANETFNSTWTSLTGGAWCDYKNDTANGEKYGHLYNWFAASDIRNIAPTGWHLPTNTEWQSLTKSYRNYGIGNYLDSLIAGKSLKETGTANWVAPNTATTNEFGFSALPGGTRTLNFDSLGYVGAWWTATQSDYSNALSRQMTYNSDKVSTVNALKSAGFSVRCTLDYGLPEITGDTVYSIKETTANYGWSISNYVGASITEQGVCYSTTPMPNKDNNKAVGLITNLTPNTKYYARAYAINSYGTAYGKEISFSTLPFNADANLAKIYATLGLSGNQQPAGDGDLIGIDEGFTSFVRLIWNLNELTTDEAICAWGDPDVPEMNFNGLTSTNAQLHGMYARLCFNITLCNYFIAQTASKTDILSLNQRAEARFMRALNYYYLLDMFGNVQFTEGNSFANATQISRTNLFNYIETELAQCETNMYDVQQAPYGRADKAANWLLRSRLLLNAEVYTGSERWADAANYAKKVMDSGYKLCPTFKHLFMADNDGSGTVNKAAQEIILPIAADGINAKSWGSSMFLIASTHSNGMVSWGTNQAWAGNRARASLVKKFFPTGSTFFSNLKDLTTAILTSFKDSRALFDKGSVSTALTITNVGNFKDGYSVIKFSNLRADGGATHDTEFPDMDVPFLRAAEAYLTYAEAMYRVGNTTESLTVINQLRARAGAVALTTIDLPKILDEKAREFFFEGQRRTDLIRFGNYGGGTYNWDWKGGVASGTTFNAHFNIFPIPQTEINTNANLIQNPGY